MAQDLESIISTLEELARATPNCQVEIGQALGIIRHHRKHGFAITNRITNLPWPSESFGGYIVFECNEIGDPVSPIKDQHGEPQEFLPGSKIVETI